jgi:serine/threonine-protein kinase RsbW
MIGINHQYYGNILVSTLEAVNNAILHGNNSDPDKFVDIEIRYNENTLMIKVIDEGNGFRPDEVADPTGPGNIQKPNGRGVFLMSRLADNIKYSKKGNAVTMTFKNIVS